MQKLTTFFRRLAYPFFFLPLPALQKAEIPVIFLLSVGADPTESIEVLARRKKVKLATDGFRCRVLDTTI